MDDDRTIAMLPDGLWSQPAVSPVDGVEAEPVQRVRIPASVVYSYTPGLAPTRFLRGLQEKKILGERCPVSGDIYLPPRGMSPAVGLPTTEQVELPHTGTVAGFCVVHIGFGVNAPPTPFCSALVLVDGASVSVYGTIQEIPYDQVRTGMRVEAVWADQLETSFENIKWWRPIDEPDVDADEMKGHL